MTNPDEVKDKFYDDLDSVISAKPRTDKLILLGDFNARVGIDHQTWEGVIGTEGIGVCNSNGLRLLKKCAEQELLITNTVFRLPTCNKMSWMHPRSKHWHLTDYIIVRLFVLRFYSPVNPMGSCRARSVYLTTRLLGMLSPLSS